MTSHTVKLPSRFDMPAALTTARQFDLTTPTETFVVDFSGVTFTQPFSILYLSSLIRRLVKEQPDVSVTFSHYEHLGYLAHMGFFRACGIEYGKDPGEAAGSPDYLPLTQLAISMKIHARRLKGTLEYSPRSWPDRTMGTFMKPLPMPFAKSSATFLSTVMQMPSGTRHNAGHL